MKTFKLTKTLIDKTFPCLLDGLKDEYGESSSWIGFINYDVIEQRIVFRTQINQALCVTLLKISDNILTAIAMSGDSFALQREGDEFYLYIDGLSAELLCKLTDYQKLLVD